MTRPDLIEKMLNHDKTSNISPRPLLICRAEEGRVVAKVWRSGRLVVAVDLDDAAALCVLRDLAEAAAEAIEHRKAMG